MTSQPADNLPAFYMPSELRKLGLRSFGYNVFINRTCVIRGHEKISVGNNVRIDDFSILAAAGNAGEIVIGDYVHINTRASLFATSRIVMEDFSGLSSNVNLFTESDDYTGRSMTNPMVPDEYRPKVSRGEIRLCKHVIIGVSSAILPNVSIGEGTAVGAHSLIVSDCDPWSIYVGSPASKRGRRRKNIKELEEKLRAEESDD